MNKNNERKKTLVRFNVQNVHWAIQNEGGYSSPKPYGTATKIALEPDSSIKKIFGDGKRIASIVNDKGKTSTLSTNNINDNFEIDMGRKMLIKNGIASIKQQKLPIFALYFETCGLNDDNSMPLAKTWLFGVTSPTAPSESFDQNTDDINESTFDTALEIGGVELKTADGKSYLDSKTGQTVRVWQLTATPDDADFENFGAQVPTPTVAGITEETEDKENVENKTASAN